MLEGRKGFEMKKISRKNSLEKNTPLREILSGFAVYKNHKNVFGQGVVPHPRIATSC